MFKLITTTQLQQKIGEISAQIKTTPFIVTNRGEGKIILLPYFNGCDDMIDEYMEDFEMYSNKEKLEKQFEKSYKSGLSNLKI